MGEMAGYISLSQHFRQIKEMRKTTVSSSWETDSGLGDSPPSTPGYAHCMPFRLEEGEQEQEQEQQEQEQEEQEQEEQQEEEEEEQKEQQEEQEQELDEQSEDQQTDWKNLLVFSGKALNLSNL
jgi:hypothetical protein